MSSDGINPTEMLRKRGVHKATEITKLQIEAAKKIHAANFAADNDAAMAAIINAIALNYSLVAQSENQ